MANQEPLWHQRAIVPQTLKTLTELRQAEVLAGFYLAGGTGMALQLGHRLSIDLDFFTSEPFNEEAVLRKLEQLPELALLQKERQTLHAVIQGIKVSFLGYDYPMLFPTRDYHGVSVADARDIAGMKISAVLSRGKKRDFIDLFVLGRHYGLKTLLGFFQEKYARSRYNLEYVLKSLTYFEDAEHDPMPNLLVSLSWEEVKMFFRKEVPPLR